MRTLIVVAHQDDESFGLGGTITKMCRENPDELQILSICKGREGGNVEEREEAFCNVVTELGCIGTWCDYYDLTLDNVPLKELADLIADHIRRHQPERVICTSIDDIHQDHVVVAKATRIACRPFNQTTVKSLYEFKIPGSSVGEFNIAVDIGDVMEEKMGLVEYYKSEVKSEPFHPLSINGLSGINKQYIIRLNKSYLVTLFTVQ